MIQIINNSTKTPLSDMGKAAGICWNAPIDDVEKNIKRAIDCIDSGHGRVMEFADVTLVVEGYSARCIRELYTHIIGTSRLQSSTRYVNEEAFEYYEPDFKNEQVSEIYVKGIDSIREDYKELLAKGATKEDAANILPLGMSTKIVLKINVRALEHFANLRLCTRAYKEIRELTKELKKTLASYSPEWKMLVDKIMVPNCIKFGYCTETKCCGKYPKKEKVLAAAKAFMEKEKNR